MSVVEEIGNIVEKRHDEIDIEWEIEDFFTIAKNREVFACPHFSFMETPWCLQLTLKSSIKPGFMCLYIRKMKSLRHPIEYDFGLKKSDGVIESLSKNTLKEKHTWNFHFINLSELKRRKSELVPSDKLVIVCSLKLKTNHSDKRKMWESPKVNKLIKLDTLSDDFRNLFGNTDSCDTTLFVMGKEYKAHRAILIARSSVFAAMFKHETREKQTGIVNITDCDSETFEEFLEFLYCGKLEEPTFRSAVDLYETSDQYEVLELKTFCSQYLMENLTVENVCDVAIMAEKYEETDLLNAAQEFFNKHRDEIFDTSDWDSLVRNNYDLSKRMLKGMSSKMKLFGC